jgi:hypothetical protein
MPIELIVAIAVAIVAVVLGFRDPSRTERGTAPVHAEEETTLIPTV